MGSPEAALFEKDYFAHLGAVASVTERFGVPGSNDHARVLEARVAGGLDFEVLPTRGFDIGNTFYKGLPMSWDSPVTATAPLAEFQGSAWLSRFNGGLLITCGLDNVGSARDRFGMHGNFSHLPATQISHSTTASPEQHGVQLDGVIESVSPFGPSLRVERTIHSWREGSDSANISVIDRIINFGGETTPMSVLHQLNLGAPLVVPGSVFEIPHRSVLSRDPSDSIGPVSVMPEFVRDSTELVYEHIDPRVEDGWATATISSPIIPVQIQVQWTLPRLYEWVFPSPRKWAVAIEPSNAARFGRGRENNFGPLLKSGERRVHEVRLLLSDHNQLGVPADDQYGNHDSNFQ